MNNNQTQKSEQPKARWHAKATIGDTTIDIDEPWQLAPEEETKLRTHGDPEMGDYVFSTREDELKWFNEGWREIRESFRK